jgi:hypothetical protein
MWAVFKGDRMVEPAFRTRVMAESVARAYGAGYVVRVVTVDVG